MLQSRVTRRDFVRVSAAVGAAFAVPAFVHAKSPNEKLNVAVIGPGGRGAAQLGAAAEMENVVAICDVDQAILGAEGKKHPKAKTYVDFRKMLGEMEKSIDAVMVSTPDHTHAPASAMAMRMGKHCYCEKPLTHTVYEARVLANLAKEKNLVTQMGTQIHAEDNYRRVVELVQAGAIGPITEVRAWSPARYGGVKRPTETPQVPKTLDWDLWLGPAAFRPYHPCYVPFQWRGWWAFGNGGLGDFGCHLMDLVFWALKLRHPTSIEAKGPAVDAESCGMDVSVEYEYAARGDLPPVKLLWFDGADAARRATPAGAKVEMGPMGVLFIGKDGMLRADYGSKTLYPIEKYKDFKAPQPTIPKSVGHHKEFFDACKTGGPTTCNFDYSGALTEAVLLGTVSYRVGKKLIWDAANLKAVGCPEADAFLRRPYRDGWTL